MTFNITYFNNFMTKAECQWPIQSFNYSCNSELRSNLFSVNTKKVPLVWCLVILRRSESSSSIYLQLLTENAPEIEVKYAFSILKDGGHRIYLEKAKKIYGKVNRHGLENCLYLNNTQNIYDILFGEPNCTISCEIAVSDIDIDIGTHKNDISKLASDFESVLNNEKYCDVEFDVSGHKFRAHKCILAGRSDVFAAMFEQEMKEAKTNCVAISDIDQKAFKEMLRFIYTNKEPRLDEVSHDLLAAAVKYNLKDLKETCEKALAKKLSVEVAANTLILADLNICQQLKKETICYINLHAVDVMKTQGWKNMIATHIHLFEEVYRAIAKQHAGCPKTKYH